MCAAHNGAVLPYPEPCHVICEGGRRNATGSDKRAIARERESARDGEKDLGVSRVWCFEVLSVYGTSWRRIIPSILKSFDCPQSIQWSIGEDAIVTMYNGR